MSKLRKAARRNKKTSVLTEHVFGKVTLSVCSFFQSLIMFSILVFLGVQKCKEEEKKKNLQHRIPQKRNPCNLDNLHILSDPDHQHSSPGHFHLLFFVFVSPLASFAMQCVAPSGGSIAFYTALVSHPHMCSVF